MAAEDEQGDSTSPNPRDDNSQLTDSTTTAAAPARPTAASNSNNSSAVTPSSTNNIIVSSTTASVTETSSTSVSNNTAAAGAASNSDSFLAAAAAEARQQVTPTSSTATSTGLSDNTLLVDSTQKMSELTASSVAAVSSKLEQVRGYIRQTSTAMQGLEQQADLGKIGQYNTLVKVLRELKTSEVKLTAHLATLMASGGAPAVAPGAPETTDVDERDVPHSQSIGLVSSRTVHAVDNTGEARATAPSFSDRLAAGMEEANQITGRLRDNVARREDLVERYRATRERLTALKRQRRDIQQQERSILLAHSTRESPYEDPIPGASSWSLDELNTGLDDFRALYGKVATLRTAYTTKAQALEEGDAAGRAEIDSKMQQLESKRAQLIGVITQLKRLRAEKLREQGMDAEIDPDDFEATSVAATPTAADGSSSSTATDPVGAVADVSQSVVVDASAPPTATTTGDSTTAAGGGPVVSAPKPELQQQLSAAVDAMEATEASAAELVSRGGSVSIGTLPAMVDGADISGGTDTADGDEDPIAAVVVARAEMEAAGRELSLRTQHLNNLKEELAGMKRLLDVTQQNRAAAAAAGEQADGPSQPPAAAVGEQAGEFITGVNGNIVRLSDLERQDPAVIEKYKQLSAAKQRMAQMEQIMQAISSSRGSGLPLNEVLSPEQLSLLEEAEAEEDPSGSARLRRSRSARRSCERDSNDGSVDRDFFNDIPRPSAAVQPSFASLPRPAANNTDVSGNRNNSTLISSSAAARRQNQLATDELSAAIKNKRSNNFAAAGGVSNNDDSDDVSTAQQRLSKPSNAARSVNEQAGRRKQQLGKQERYGSEDFNNQHQFSRPNNSQRVEDASSARSRSSSCNERTALAAGSRGGVTGDPRVAAIATLQEELRQKKNALEALMRGMGKPSSLHPDNISDNISDGESGSLTPTPSRPARGRRGNRDHSVDFSTSLAEDYRSRSTRQQVSAAPQHTAQAENVATGGLSLHHPQQRLHTPSGAVMSFNNLSASGEGDGGPSSRSVRPKQNSRSSVSRLPDSDGNRSNILGDATNTQQTISEALQQLSTVQGSINSLYDTLRTDRDARSSTPSVAPTASNNRQQVALQQQQQQQQELKYQQQLQQQQALNNMFALAAPAQPPSLLPGAVPSEAPAPAVPLVSGLQQCFSQLYLHSLEIQALNKHIQVRHQQQMLQLQHLHQQQQLQQVQQQQQQQLLGAGSTGLLQQQQSLVPSVYYNAPSLSFMSLPSSPYTGGVASVPAVSSAGVLPTGVGSLPSAPAAGVLGASVAGVAPTNLPTYPIFPNLPPF